MGHGVTKMVCPRLTLTVLTVLTVLCIGATDYAQSPKIKIPPEIAAYGVTLLSASNPLASEFVHSLLGAEAAAFAPVLPYGAVIVNNGEHRLLQTSVGFKWRDPARIVPNPALYISLTAFSRAVPTQVKPGDSKLVFPSRELNYWVGRKAYDPGNAAPVSTVMEAINKVAQDFAPRASTFNLELDSVTVEHVGLVGPDVVGRRNHDTAELLRGELP